MFANLTSLNNWRQSRGFSTFRFRSLTLSCADGVLMKIPSFSALIAAKPGIQTTSRLRTSRRTPSRTEFSFAKCLHCNTSFT